MQLISYEFIGFLILGAVLYYSVFRKHQWILLLILSVCFYLAAGWKLLLFPVFTAALTWASALLIAKTAELIRQRKKDKKNEADPCKAGTDALKARKRRILRVCLILCFGVLGVVKYTDFVLSLIGKLINAFGVPGSFDKVGFLLPLGISYYTFQAMGYLIDVYRGKYGPESNYLKVLLFVMFFPQLTSGPISRYDQIGESLSSGHRWNADDTIDGMQRILWGFFKKLVIADRMSGPVMAIINAPEQYQGIFVLLGMVGFTLWMYADFSGGIDIVLGAARLFGIKLPENFDLPFISASLAEFWTRWHMTLMSWMRDYVFYSVATAKTTRRITKKTGVILPKGLNTRMNAYIASLTVWFITGIWHGASERFVIWGMANFFVMSVSQELSPLYRKARRICPWMSGRVWRGFMAVRTFLLFSVLEMFECYPIRTVFSRLWNLLTVPLVPGGFVHSVQSLGLASSEWRLLGAAWIVILLSAGIRIWTSDPERSMSFYRTRFFRIGSIYCLFIVVLVMGRYGHGYAVADFFYNSF